MYNYSDTYVKFIIIPKLEYSVNYQIIGRKSNPIFWPLKYLIERTVASIQQVEYVCSDI